MTNKLRYLVFVLLLTFSASAQDSTQNDNTDSVNRQMLSQYRQKLAETEQQRLADSVQKRELETKLNLLHASDQLQKEQLQKELAALAEKENERLRQKTQRIDSLRKHATGHPVMGFFNDTLFMVYNRSGSFSAA